MSARPKILVLDDSSLALEVIRASLETAGFDVDIAADIATFERTRVRNLPDVIVVDVQMPEAFGDDLASTLRGAYGVEVPIILLSTLPQAELATRASIADVWGYVSKREGMPSLIARIREALDGQQKQ